MAGDFFFLFFLVHEAHPLQELLVAVLGTAEPGDRAAS